MVYIRLPTEVYDIGVMIHAPEDVEAQQELMRKVAAIHAQTVIEKVKSMPYSTEQKGQLIDAIKLYISK